MIGIAVSLASTQPKVLEYMHYEKKKCFAIGLTT